jgi:hypothetical protein
MGVTEKIRLHAGQAPVGQVGDAPYPAMPYDPGCGRLLHHTNIKGDAWS